MKLRRRPKGERSRGVYLFPNILTSLSLFAGFYSLVSTLNGDLVKAAWAIILALLFDNLDGRAARAARATSRFGLEYDSLTDLVSFGVAPGILVYVWALRPFGKLGWLAAFLYLSSAALRLARFNVQVDKVESRRFNGLPSPAAASVVAAVILLYNDLEIPGPEHSLLVLVLVYVLAFLMVSNVKYRSLKEQNLLRKRPFSTLFILVLLLVLVAAQPVILLSSLFFLYLISGIVEAPLILIKKGLARKRGGEEVKSQPTPSQSHTS